MIKRVRGLFAGRRDLVVGASHLAVMTIALQGAPLVSQAVTAILVAPPTIGSIRTFEAALAVSIFVAGLGASSLAVREVAAANHEHKRRIASDLLILPVIGSITLLAVSAIALWIGPSNWASSLRLALNTAALVLLININRTLGGLVQGFGQVRRLALPMALASAVAVVLHVSAAVYGALWGWTIGRYVGEVVVLATFVLTLGRLSEVADWGGINFRRLGTLMMSAAILNAAFVARSLADGIPLLALAASASGSQSIGAFGVATLLLTLAMLPISILAQFMLPGLAHSRDQDDGAKRNVVLLSAGLGLAAAIGLAVLAQLAGRYVIPESALAMNLTTLMALVIPFKAAAIGFGTRLIASGRYAGPLTGNVVELIVVAAICAWGTGPWTSAWALVVGAVVSFACLGWLATRESKMQSA